MGAEMGAVVAPELVAPLMELLIELSLLLLLLLALVVTAEVPDGAAVCNDARCCEKNTPSTSRPVKMIVAMAVMLQLGNHTRDEFVERTTKCVS